VVLLGLINQVHRIDRLRRPAARTRPRRFVLAKDRRQNEQQNREKQNERQQTLKVRRHPEHDTPQTPRGQRPRLPPQGEAARRGRSWLSSKCRRATEKTTWSTRSLKCCSISQGLLILSIMTNSRM